MYSPKNTRYYGPHNGSPPPPNRHDYSDTGSEIYVDQTYHGVNNHTGLSHQNAPPPPPPPRISRNIPPGTPRAITPIGRPNTTTPSEYSSVSKTKNKRKGGVVIETMSAPNPCCPDSRGVCCILLLINLGLLLVTLGFSVVLQIFEPPFVWYCGILFIIVGFLALIVSLLFCMRICRVSRWYDNGSNYGDNPNELYWTHHWQKRINLPSYNRNSNNGRGLTPI